MRKWTWLFLVGAACGNSEPSESADGGAGGDSGAGGDGNGSTLCPRTPAAADRDRFVVVAHPYDTNGGSVPNFEVLKLDMAGTLTQMSPVRMFQLGNRMPFGNIAFTPDGTIGIAPLDNGKLGVFELSPEGVPTVIDPAFSGSFYAQRVVMDPSGDRAWVIDRNTRPNGGGIYEVGINCDGTLVDRGLVAAARSPGGMAFSGTKAILAARDVLSSPETVSDVHVLDFSANPPAYMGGGDTFGDDNQGFSGFALSHDGATVFVGDSNVTGNNRVAIGTVGATSVTALTTITMITDPSGIVASPFGDVAIVTSSQPPGEGVYVLDKQGPSSTWRNRGELTYVNGTAELPGDMAMIERGTLTGRVLVSELSRIRVVSIASSGTVTDVGSVVFGDGLEHIGGAIGVQP